MLSSAALATSLIPASAAAVTFHASAEPITITVSSDGTGKTAHQVFDIANWPMTCAGMKAQATVSSGKTFGDWKTETASYLPVEKGACLFGGAPVIAPPTMEGCSYRFHASGTFDVECPAGKAIDYFTSPPLGCELTIPAQTNVSKVGYHNIEVAGTKAITMEINVSNLSYVATGMGCGVEAGVHNDGEYTTGNVVLTAESPATGAPVPLWIE